MKSKAGDQLVTHAKLKSVWLRRFNPFNGEQEPPLFVAKTDVDSWQKPFFKAHLNITANGHINLALLLFNHVGVSINGGTPKWIVYNGTFH